jgi:sugar phosphate isomerase/epimerase
VTPVPLSSEGIPFAVSTWSLHRTLGVMYRDAPGDDGERAAVDAFGKPQNSLLEIPARVAQMGIGRLEISHFHLPSRDASYCNELKAALNDAGVELFTLLVENGDMTHPQHHDRDLTWIRKCVETAGLLGAKRARIIAGKQPYSADAMRLSVQGFQELVNCGADYGVQIVTENWFPLLETPAAVHELFERLGDSIGLNADYGNWEGERKYADLAQIFPLAQSCHAKCGWLADGSPDFADYARCTDAALDAGFDGVYTLVYDAPDADEWQGLAMEQAFLAGHLAQHRSPAV